MTIAFYEKPDNKHFGLNKLYVFVSTIHSTIVIRIESYMTCKQMIGVVLQQNAIYKIRQWVTCTGVYQPLFQSVKSRSSTYKIGPVGVICWKHLRKDKVKWSAITSQVGIIKFNFHAANEKSKEI